MKIKNFILSLCLVMVVIIAVKCDKNDAKTVNSKMETSAIMTNDVTYLNNLYKNLHTESIDSIINYLDEQIKTRSLSSEEKQSTFRSEELGSDYQQIISEEYVEPYFVENTVDGISKVEYIGDFNYQNLINDSRLSLEDREMILVAYVTIDDFLPDVPYGPGYLASDCLAEYKYELYNICVYYFSLNFITFTPILSQYFADAWNAKFGYNLVTNNHQNDIDAAERRYKRCLGS